jgi:hypothetical protein
MKTCDDDGALRAARAARWNLQDTIAELLPGNRICACCRKRLHPAVGVHRQGFFSGLVTCSSVWVCPICSAKITERRRLEIREAMARALKREWKPYLLTLTYRHNRFDDLEASVIGFTAARRRFLNRHAWKNFKDLVGYEGSIYCLEITHSHRNGWHCHSHEIIFVSGIAQDSIEGRDRWINELLPSWQDSCISVGLGEPNVHGLHIQNAEAASNYLSTWSVDLELTKAFSKKGRLDSKTPWDLARDFQQIGDLESAQLFREFARVFKGKKQLVWSKGLRTKLGMEPEKSDKKVAEEMGEGREPVCNLSRAQWAMVLSFRARSQILEIARSGGSESDIFAFIHKLPFAGSESFDYRNWESWTGS